MIFFVERAREIHQQFETALVVLIRQHQRQDLCRDGADLPRPVGHRRDRLVGRSSCNVVSPILSVTGGVMRVSITSHIRSPGPLSAMKLAGGTSTRGVPIPAMRSVT